MIKPASSGATQQEDSLIFALFYYTLCMLLVTILASAACLAVYLVSHKRVMFFAFWGFLFYFFDIALVLQNDFSTSLQIEHTVLYETVTMLATVVTGLGFLGSFWLLLCDYFKVKKRAAIIAPPIIFALASLAMMLLPDGDSRQFFFYTTREVFLYGMLLFAGIRYLRTKDGIEKSRMGRHKGLYALLWILGIAILLEDVTFFLFLDPARIEFGPRSYSINRNFSENALMLCCMIFACRDAYRVLSLRFERPPKNFDKSQEPLVEDGLALYGKRYQLSEREQEVLGLILLGKDNQNIASTMNLALSTVKVHVHNILQKTKQPNRQALVQDYWKVS